VSNEYRSTAVSYDPSRTSVSHAVGSSGSQDLTMDRVTIVSPLVDSAQVYMLVVDKSAANAIHNNLYNVAGHCWRSNEAAANLVLWKPQDGQKKPG